MDASTSAMSQDASASTSAVVNAIVEEVIVGAVEEAPASAASTLAPTAVEEESTGVEATQEATADSAMEVDTVKETVLPSADEEKEESATTDAASSSTTGAPSAPATADADLPNIDNSAWPAHSIVWAKVKGYPWWPGMVWCGVEHGMRAAVKNTSLIMHSIRPPFLIVHTIVVTWTLFAFRF